MLFAFWLVAVCVVSRIQGPYGPIQLPDRAASEGKMKAFKERIFNSSITIPDAIGGQYSLTQVAMYEVGVFYFIFISTV
jgi:hypothetical protein